MAHMSKAYRAQLDPAERGADQMLDRMDRCAHERNAEAYETLAGKGGQADVMAVARQGRATGSHWHLRVRGVWVRCSREDLRAVLVSVLS